MTIYDILRELVTMQTWRSESDLRKRIDVIDNAEKNMVFGTEGKFDLE